MISNMQLEMLENAVAAGNEQLGTVLFVAYTLNDVDTVYYILERTDWHTVENFGKENLSIIQSVAAEYATEKQQNETVH